ncbi:MAG TPA: TetR/AcrR family transcriptional regulator [Rhizomicrobium sp.]|nr:TetR/AcrR family transcriptional regulator [Rhizomicrobium sp.]
MKNSVRSKQVAKKSPAPQPVAQTPPPPRMNARERNRVRMHDDIYQAALSLFNDRGYADVTVDDICEAAGISKATFFRYFDSKFGLVDEFNQRIAAKIDASIDIKTMSATECIRRATETLYQEWLHSAPQIRVLAREFVRAGTHITENLGDPMARGLIATLVAVIAEGQKRGEFDPQFDPVLVAPLIVSAWTFAFVAWVDRNDHEAFHRSVHNLVELHIMGLTYNVMKSGAQKRSA